MSEPKPLTDDALRDIEAEAHDYGDAESIVGILDGAEMRALLFEVRRHRDIAAALVSDDPDSSFDAGIVEVRRRVRETIERVRSPAPAARAAPPDLAGLVGQIVDGHWYIEARVGSANYRGDVVHFIIDRRGDPTLRDGESCYRNEPAEKVVAALLAESAKLREERDEARAGKQEWIARFRSAEFREVKAALEERDAARAEAGKLREERDAFVSTYRAIHDVLLGKGPGDDPTAAAVARRISHPQAAARLRERVGETLRQAEEQLRLYRAGFGEPPLGDAGCGKLTRAIARVVEDRAALRAETKESDHE